MQTDLDKKTDEKEEPIVKSEKKNNQYWLPRYHTSHFSGKAINHLPPFVRSFAFLMPGALASAVSLQLILAINNALPKFSPVLPFLNAPLCRQIHARYLHAARTDLTFLVLKPILPPPPSTRPLLAFLLHSLAPLEILPPK